MALTLLVIRLEAFSKARGDIELSLPILYFIFSAKAGDPDRIRTCGPQIRNLVLYPAELRGPGAGATLALFALQLNRPARSYPAFTI